MTLAYQPAQLVTLINNKGMRITCMDLGATWLSCRLPTGKDLQEVLLGGARHEDYQNQSAYLGATIGRYANRIANGCYAHNGEIIKLSTNQNGNTLHGGPDGFDRKTWQIETIAEDNVIFTLTSPDGDQGFPGEVKAVATYSLRNDNSVTIDYRAYSSASTPINLSNHAYFNLNDAQNGDDSRSHYLKINASRYLPVDQQGIPISGLRNVEGTRFDFRRRRRIRNDYDHAFLLDTESDYPHSPCLSLTSAQNKLTMDLFTNKPAVQIYTGRWLAGTPNRRHGVYKAHAGIALETEFLPDTPNHSHWPQPDCFFSNDKIYQFTTCYRFSW